MPSNHSRRPEAHEHSCSTFWGFFWNSKKVFDWSTCTAVCKDCGVTVKVSNHFAKAFPQKVFILAFVVTIMTQIVFYIMKPHYGPFISGGISCLIWNLLFIIAKKILVAKLLSDEMWCEVKTPEMTKCGIIEKLKYEAATLKKNVSSAVTLGFFTPLTVAVVITVLFR